VIQHRFKLLLHLNYQGAQAVHHLLVRDRRFLFPYKDRPAPGFSLAQPWPDSNSLSNGCCCSAATTWRHCAGTAAWPPGGPGRWGGPVRAGMRRVCRTAGLKVRTAAARVRARRWRGRRMPVMW